MQWHVQALFHLFGARKCCCLWTKTATNAKTHTVLVSQHIVPDFPRGKRTRKELDCTLQWGESYHINSSVYDQFVRFIPFLYSSIAARPSDETKPGHENGWDVPTKDVGLPIVLLVEDIFLINVLALAPKVKVNAEDVALSSATLRSGSWHTV